MGHFHNPQVSLIDCTYRAHDSGLPVEHCTQREREKDIVIALSIQRKSVCVCVCVWGRERLRESRGREGGGRGVLLTVVSDWSC